MHCYSPQSSSPASPGTPNQTFAHSAEALDKLRLHPHFSPELWCCLSSASSPRWTLDLPCSHVCGTSLSPSPSCCSHLCPCLLLLVPWMDPCGSSPCLVWGCWTSLPTLWSCTLASAGTRASLSSQLIPCLWSSSLTGRARGAPQSQQ